MHRVVDAVLLWSPPDKSASHARLLDQLVPSMDVDFLVDVLRLCADICNDRDRITQDIVVVDDDDNNSTDERRPYHYSLAAETSKSQRAVAAMFVAAHKHDLSPKDLAMLLSALKGILGLNDSESIACHHPAPQQGASSTEMALMLLDAEREIAGRERSERRDDHCDANGGETNVPVHTGRMPRRGCAVARRWRSR